MMAPGSSSLASRKTQTESKPMKLTSPLRAILVPILALLTSTGHAHPGHFVLDYTAGPPHPGHADQLSTLLLSIALTMLVFAFSRFIVKRRG